VVKLPLVPRCKSVQHGTADSAYLIADWRTQRNDPGMTNGKELVVRVFSRKTIQTHILYIDSPAEKC
jgi:hypothetical protein